MGVRCLPKNSPIIVIVLLHLKLYYYKTISGLVDKERKSIFLFSTSVSFSKANYFSLNYSNKINYSFPNHRNKINLMVCSQLWNVNWNWHVLLCTKSFQKHRRILLLSFSPLLRYNQYPRLLECVPKYSEDICSQWYHLVSTWRNRDIIMKLTQEENKKTNSHEIHFSVNSL